MAPARRSQRRLCSSSTPCSRPRRRQTPTEIENLSQINGNENSGHTPNHLAITNGHLSDEEIEIMQPPPRRPRRSELSQQSQPSEPSQKPPRRSPRKTKQAKYNERASDIENEVEDEEEEEDPAEKEEKDKLTKLKTQKTDDMVRYFILSTQTHKAVQRVELVKKVLGKENSRYFDEIFDKCRRKLRRVFGLDVSTQVFGFLCGGFGVVWAVLGLF